MKAPNKFIEFIEKSIAGYEIVDWILEVSNEDMEVSNIQIANEPTGEYQGEHEYCNQEEHATESGVYAFSGTYYHKFEGSNLWLAYDYYMDA